MAAFQMQRVGIFNTFSRLLLLTSDNENMNKLAYKPHYLELPQCEVGTRQSLRNTWEGCGEYGHSKRNFRAKVVRHPRPVVNQKY